MEIQLSSEGTTVVLGGVDLPDTAGSIDIDRASFDGTWYRGETGMVWFLDEGALASLRQGRDLTAYLAGQDPMSLDLTGSAAALLKLEECVSRGGEAKSASASAPAPAPKPPEQVPPGVVIWPANVPPQPVENDTQFLGENCPQWGEFASGPSEIAVKARFVNEADRAASIYWIGFDGTLTEYAGLLPGEKFDVDTFEGHVWVAKDFGGTCLGKGAIFPRAGKPNRFKLR